VENNGAIERGSDARKLREGKGKRDRPAHENGGVVNIVATNPDGQFATLAFNYEYKFPRAPLTSSISPNQGSVSGGTIVTIAGGGFVSGATMTFDGVPAVTTFVSSTSLAATTAAHAAGSVDLMVTNPDTQSATAPAGFTFSTIVPPTISAITPASGTTAGGTAVTITGTNFASGASVTIGGTAATSITFVSSTQITATTPAHTTGAASVIVTNPDASSATLASGFTYVAPAPPGDANGDGQVSVGDVFYLINNLFAGGPGAVAGDANGDGQVTVGDVFHLINYLFAGGPAPH
jgi:large repetitive protein